MERRKSLEGRSNDAIKVLEDACQAAKSAYGANSLKYAEIVADVVEIQMKGKAISTARELLEGINLNFDTQLGIMHPLSRRVRELRIRVDSGENVDESTLVDEKTVVTSRP